MLLHYLIALLCVVFCGIEMSAFGKIWSQKIYEESIVVKSSSCKHWTRDYLKSIHGSAFNSRYMAIEKPLEENEKDNVRLTRNQSFVEQIPSFSVKADFRRDLSNKSADVDLIERLILPDLPEEPAILSNSEQDGEVAKSHLTETSNTRKRAPVLPEEITISSSLSEEEAISHSSEASNTRKQTSGLPGRTAILPGKDLDSLSTEAPNTEKRTSEVLSTTEIATVAQHPRKEAAVIQNTGMRTGGQNTETRVTEGPNTGKHLAGSKNTETQATGNQNNGKRTAGGHNTGTRTAGNQNTGKRTAGGYNIGTRTAGIQNTGKRTAGGHNTGSRAVAGQTTRRRTTGVQNGGFRVQTFEDQLFQFFNHEGGKRRRSRGVSPMSVKSGPWCDSKVTWTDLGPDYFPRFIRSVECLSDTCYFKMYHCVPRAFTVKVLRRKSGYCIKTSRGTDYELSELWIWEERAVTFCCDCTFQTE